MAKAIVSIGIETFLDYMRETEQCYHIAVAEEKAANDATQDILHAIELEKHSYHEIAKMGKKLREVRQQRRTAKNLMDQAQPVWARSVR